MKLFLLSLYLVAVSILSHGLCPADRTKYCMDKADTFCCVREGQTTCTCANDGWKSMNKNLPGRGCPYAAVKKCENNEKYNGCCEGQYYRVTDCDVVADQGHCGYLGGGVV